MKKSIISIGLILGVVALFQACNDFEEINKNPLAANSEQVQVEYFINNSIIGAQQDPEVAERSFVLYWKAAGRMDRINSLPIGNYDDDWSNNYFNALSAWLGHANTAIQVAEEKEKKGKTQPYSNNLKQIARIWRAYLMSEMSDQYGPMPINGYQGVNPNFNSVEEVYNFLLNELKEAVAAIDTDVTVPESVAKLDPAFGYNAIKWKNYGSSLRMRFAMRISNVVEDVARSHFEDAVKVGFIADNDGNFEVQEKPGWDPLTGVMSREWNMQKLSATMNNLYVGLGGIESSQQLPVYTHSHIKTNDWMGVKYDKHFATKTNAPMAGFWFDGLPATIDPRAYKAFVVPGDFNNPQYNRYPSWVPDYTSKTKRALLAENGTDTLVILDGAFTWNAYALGDWGKKGSLNQVYGWPGAGPRLANRFRDSSSKRLFFGSWESYFLIAEAAVKGWTVPMGGQQAYEEGIKQSFVYWQIDDFYSSYITSQNYNRVGTSVAWGHTIEARTTTMKYKDGYTNKESTMAYVYPKNGLYENGRVNNDHLTKIITQKFIAQIPWLPLETWSDHRRLGLPFFENPAIEKPLTSLPALTETNYMESKLEFFPQRIPYPSFLSNNVPEGYKQAVDLLGGDDKVLTPLWWAKKK